MRSPYWARVSFPLIVTSVAPLFVTGVLMAFGAYYVLTKPSYLPDDE